MKNEKMKEILDFFRNNKKKTCIGAGAGVAVIAVCVAVGITLGNGAKTTASNTGTQTQTETTTETAETETTLQMPLEENTVPEVTQLITEYYNAAAAGDMDTINSIVNTYDQETQIYLQKMSEHIEAYQNVVCYTKTGPVDGSYLVYAYYEIKFNDLETAVPGISPYLVYPREDGSLYIYEGDVEDSVNQYLEDISAQDDVIDLMNRVQVVFNEAVMQDDTLNNYLAQLKEDLQVEVGEALAEAETASEEETQPTEAAAEVQTTVTKVEATDVVNVRSSDSEQAERLGKVAVGEVLKLLDETKPKADLTGKLDRFFDMGQKEVALYYPIWREKTYAAEDEKTLPQDCCKPRYVIVDGIAHPYTKYSQLPDAFTLRYEAYPADIPDNAPDETEFDLPDEAVLAVIFFAAAQTQSMEYDQRFFQSFYAQYQGKLSNLSGQADGPAAVVTGGCNV